MYHYRIKLSPGACRECGLHQTMSVSYELALVRDLPMYVNAAKA